MPLPLLILPVVVVATLGAAIVATRSKIWKVLDKRTVAILGAPRTGKTSLIRLLRDFDAPDAGMSSETPGQNRGRFTLEIKAKTINFAVPQDLPGIGGVGSAEWKKAFADADHVWYLFRADLIARGDDEATQVMRTHLALFRNWLDAKNGAEPKIILVGTWADGHPDHAQQPSRLAKAVMDTSVIKIGRVKLNAAAVVVGSLSTAKDADKLLKGIKSRLQ